MRAHFNLKQKIILLVAIPSFAFLFFTISKMVDSFGDYKEAVVAGKNITLFRSISYMIHEILKEHDRSAQFFKGTISETELQKQRSITDRSIKDFEEKLPLSPIADKITNAHKKNLIIFFNARKVIRGTEIVGTCSKVLKQITRNVADVESNKELFSKLNEAGKKLGENTQHLSLAVTSLSNIVN